MTSTKASSDSNNVMYCSQQINIPPELPDILKQFTKAAIRTQPRDLLEWATAYFLALSQGDTLPVKDRVEFPIATQKTDTGLTIGLLSVLHRQLGVNEQIEFKELSEKWNQLSLPREQLTELLRIGGFDEEINWLRFMALACSSIARNITQSMKVLCEILTNDPYGGASKIVFEVFKDAYIFLARIDGGVSQTQIDSVIEYLEKHVKKQDGMVKPSNFLAEDCPKLDTES